MADIAKFMSSHFYVGCTQWAALTAGRNTGKQRLEQRAHYPQLIDELLHFLLKNCQMRGVTACIHYPWMKVQNVPKANKQSLNVTTTKNTLNFSKCFEENIGRITNAVQSHKDCQNSGSQLTDELLPIWSYLLAHARNGCPYNSQLTQLTE